MVILNSYINFPVNDVNANPTCLTSINFRSPSQGELEGTATHEITYSQSRMKLLNETQELYVLPLPGGVRENGHT